VTWPTEFADERYMETLPSSTFVTDGFHRLRREQPGARAQSTVRR
jgi:hypothetical protein